MSPTPAPPEPAVLSAPPCATPNPDPTQWFQQEVHPHDGQLKAYLREAFRIRDTEDIVQESYLRIWKAKAARPIQSAKTFLFSIAKHLAIDQLRRKKPVSLDELRDSAGLDVLDDAPGAVDLLTAKDKARFLAEAIAALPTRCREVILLNKIDGLSQKETAAQLGLSVRTVENHVQKGTRLCEAHLRARGLTGFHCE